MNKKIMKRAMAFALTLALAAGNTAIVSAQTKKAPSEKSYIVTTEGKEAYAAVSKKYGDKIKNQECLKELEGESILLVELTQSEAVQMKQNSDVVSVEEDIELTGLAEDMNEAENPWEALDLNQWNLDAINVPDKGAADTQKIKVGVLDSGACYSDDVDITERINFISGEEETSPLWEDVTGHGTAMTGLIGAKDNKEGIVGVAPDTDLYSLKVLDDEDKTTVSRVVAGIYWAIDNDMDILNMSFGTLSNSSALHNAIMDAKKAGILMIGASGNDENGAVQYPAAYPEVVAVGASTPSGELADFTSKGSQLEITAPGQSVVSTGFLDGVVGLSGTSAAAAQVTGAAAILWAMDQSKPADFVRGLLDASSRKLVDGTANNVGLIDVKQAISCYNEYEKLYNQGAMNRSQLNDNIAEDFGDVETIEALWTAEKHGDIITGYMQPNAPSLEGKAKKIAVTAKEADTGIYHVTSTLHGTGNYIKGLKYLYLVAKNVDKGQSNAAASANAYAQIPAEGNDMVDVTKGLTETMLAKGSSDDKERSYRVLGFALHSVGDAYAHRPYVYELTGFNKSDFPNYNGFLAAVNSSKGLEYRYIKDHTSVPLSKYEDNPEIGPKRFHYAKIKCLDFYNAYDDKNGYYSSRFFEGINPLTLDKFNLYVSSY